jgi:hypothetical protein
MSVLPAISISTDPFYLIMALTAHPFHPVTQELLPGYRDAYLRGDLSVKNTDLVDAYLKANPEKGGEAFQRFHTLKTKGHDVRPVGWLQHQFELIRTEPARFRQRAGAIVAVAALLSGAAFAGTNLHSTASATLPASTAVVATTEAASSAATVAEATVASRMTTVSGRILDENGRPLIGATVLDKARGRGVSTDAQGNYSLTVPANQASQLQVGYGGYGEADLHVQVKGYSVQNVTLVPQGKPTKKHHWWQF